ncbi:probable WRKY transcription factor 1 [Octopus vulgaris]|uniref:Probable WRKY transcription factor 1 n=1 Tax=Octopus vulgaris TaxID=6645 RepID=A0AA36BNS4_OCTVU|nr:probable WRKY transcription factor 1 [Octopus vulgaris]
MGVDKANKAFSPSSPSKETENKSKIFKGSALVSALLDIGDQRFATRSVALDFARRLFRLGLVRSIFGACNFEDSVQLYTWHNGEDIERVSNTNRNCRGCSECFQCRSRARFNKGMTKNHPAYSRSTTSQNTDNQYSRKLQTPSDDRMNVNAQFVEDVRNKLLSIGGVSSSNSPTDSCGDPHTKAYSAYQRYTTFN